MKGGASRREKSGGEFLGSVMPRRTTQALRSLGSLPLFAAMYDIVGNLILVSYDIVGN